MFLLYLHQNDTCLQLQWHQPWVDVHVEVTVTIYANYIGPSVMTDAN